MAGGGVRGGGVAGGGMSGGGMAGSLRQTVFTREQCIQEHMCDWCGEESHSSCSVNKTKS